MNYMGDYPTGAVVRMPWDSFAGATGASSAASAFANTDILIYKNGSTTQRSSAAGITVSTSFDSQTGLQLVEIDTSDNTDAGFYAAGNDYLVAVADVTIDSQTVRFWLGSFSIERNLGTLALVELIKAKTDNLPSDPADASDIAAAIAVTNGKVDAVKAVVDTIDTRVDTEIAAIITALATIDGRIDTEIATIITQTGAAAIRTALGMSSANLDAQIGVLYGVIDTEVASILAAVDTEIASIISTQGTQGTTLANIYAAIDTEVSSIQGAIAALNNLSAATVKAQVVAALATDTYAEPGQGVPTSTINLAEKIGHIYKQLINKVEQTATQYSVYNSAGTVVDQKAAVSDDGTTFQRAKIASGP